MTNNKLQFWFSTLVIILIAATRLLPHTDNFVPVFAMILFASVHLQNKWQAVLVSISALWLSDLYINNWGRFSDYHNEFVLLSSPFNYAAYILITLISIQLFKSTISVKKVFGSSLLIGFIFASSTIWNGNLTFLQTYAWLIGALSSSIVYYLLASK